MRMRSGGVEGVAQRRGVSLATRRPRRQPARSLARWAHPRPGSTVKLYRACVAQRAPAYAFDRSFPRASTRRHALRDSGVSRRARGIPRESDHARRTALGARARHTLHALCRRLRRLPGCPAIAGTAGRRCGFTGLFCRRARPALRSRRAGARQWRANECDRCRFRRKAYGRLSSAGGTGARRRRLLPIPGSRPRDSPPAASSRSARHFLPREKNSSSRSTTTITANCTR